MFFNVNICLFAWIEIFGNLKRNFEAVIKLSRLFVIYNELCVKIKPAVAVHTRICIYVKLIAFLCVVKENLSVIHIKSLYKRAVEVNYKLRIYCVPALLICVGQNYKLNIFTSVLLGNYKLFIKPCVLILLAAPPLIFTELTEALVNLRQGVVRLVAAFSVKEAVDMGLGNRHILLKSVKKHSHSVLIKISHNYLSSLNMSEIR